MKPVKFPQQNLTYTKPEGWKDEECQPLPVYKGTDQTGHPQIISKWELTDEELALINKTKTIYLGVCATQQPPVWLSVESPFVEDQTPNT